MQENTPPPQYMDDEIDLFELWDNIWQQRILVVIITGLATVIGLAYALMASPVYQSEAVIGKPQPHEVSQIDLSSLFDEQDLSIAPKELYRQFLETIDSTEVVRQLIENDKINNYYLDTLLLSSPRALERMEDDFEITLPSGGDEQYVNQDRSLLSFKARDPEISQTVIKQLVSFSSDVTTSQVIQNLQTVLIDKKTALEKKYQLEDNRVSEEINAEIERLEERDRVKLKRLEQRVDALRERADLENQQKIERLKADLEIAKALGIENPENPFDYQRQDGSQANVVNLLQNAPSRFWLGTKTIEQEIDNLESRDNLDPFIDGLPGIFEQQTLLESNPEIESLQNRENNHPYSDRLRNLSNSIEQINTGIEQIKTADFSVYRMIKHPALPIDPIKPNKKLIVVLSVLLGGMFGVFVALIRSAVRNRKA